MEVYVQALLAEIASAKIESTIDTVYIGGGTPTALPSFLLCRILNAVCALPLAANAEITVEANPGTLNPAYLQAINAHGANRLSLGLQTTQPHLLRTLGRVHSWEDFLQNYHAAKAAGFDNINVDLMFANPGQTIENWHETLEEIIALSPQHISAYSLTPAEGTPLWDAIASDTIHLPSDEIDREMYHHARGRLAQAGYIHYEISNFAKPGFESRHNINCWRRVPYIGFGLGAHSFDGKGRWHNIEDIKRYVSTAPHTIDKKSLQTLTESEAMCESIILGLRLMRGIPEANIPGCHENTTQRLVAEGLLSRTQHGRICLTPKGMDLANRVFAGFL